MFSIVKKGITSVYNSLSPSKRRDMAAAAEMNQYKARLASFGISKPSGKKRASGAKGKAGALRWPHQTPTAEQVELPSPVSWVSGEC